MARSELRAAYFYAMGQFVLITATATAVAAQEVCVECSGPAATYKCSVKDSEKISGYRNGGRALEYICITELAKAGHQTCRVSREFTGTCLGQPRLLDISRPSDQSAVVTEPSSPGASDPSQPAQVRTKEDEPPQTLEELARVTAAKSKQQFEENDQKFKEAAKNAGAEIEKAGVAVGDAVKKSVGCLVTLFTQC